MIKKFLHGTFLVNNYKRLQLPYCTLANSKIFMNYIKPESDPRWLIKGDLNKCAMYIKSINCAITIYGKINRPSTDKIHIVSLLPLKFWLALAKTYSCCDATYILAAGVLECWTPQNCADVKADSRYHYINNEENGEHCKIVPNLECNKYFCCEECFDYSGDSVELKLSPDSDVVVDVNKSLFSDLLNCATLEEDIVCEKCHKTWHKVCALHIDDIWGKRFICLRCGVRNQDLLRSANLPHCDMSRFIQERVGDWQQMEQKNLKINIRVLSISNKSGEIKPEMRRIFVQNGGMPENLPYKSKSIFAFQEQPDDGSEICLFGMHTQEYGSDCPSPNTRRAYISYLDSVNFFQPPQLRTDFYHRLLISYLEYCSQLGFISVHIWACPPEGETDYIFRGHPKSQQVPTPEILKNCGKSQSKYYESIY